MERAACEIADRFYHENLEAGLNGFWVEAKDLRVGDVFIGANGELSTLTNIVRVEQEDGIAVFNFTVEGNHDYFVLAKEYGLGQTCVLVHNSCHTTVASSVTEALRKQFNSSGRSNFLKALAEANENSGVFTKKQIAAMKNGTVPDDFIVHHIRPLFRGGTNSFKNLVLMRASYHLANFSQLHNYTMLSQLSELKKFAGSVFFGK